MGVRSFVRSFAQNSRITNQLVMGMPDKKKKRGNGLAINGEKENACSFPKIRINNPMLNEEGIMWKGRERTKCRKWCLRTFITRICSSCGGMSYGILKEGKMIR